MRNSYAGSVEGAEHRALPLNVHRGEDALERRTSTSTCQGPSGGVQRGSRRSPRLVLRTRGHVAHLLDSQIEKAHSNSASST